MGKSANKETAFYAVLAHITAMFDSMDPDDILQADRGEFTEEALREALDMVQEGLYQIRYPGHGTHVDPRDDYCALCQKKKTQRTLSTYQVQGMRLTVCRNCVRDLIEQEIMSE